MPTDERCTIRSKLIDDQMRVAVEGVIDVYNLGLLADAMDEAAASGTMSIVVDCSGLRSLDRTGAYVLVATWFRLGAAGRSVRVVEARALVVASLVAAGGEAMLSSTL